MAFMPLWESLSSQLTPPKGGLENLLVGLGMLLLISPSGREEPSETVLLLVI